MRFASLPAKISKSFTVNKFDGGENLCDNPRTVDSKQLTDCKNMWFNNGILKTRPGLKSGLDSVLHKFELYQYDNIICKISDTPVYIDNACKYIVTIGAECDSSIYFYNFYLLSPEGEITPAGEIIYNRISSEVFNKPRNIFFYSGNAVSGGGIFAFVTLQNGEDEESRYYEVLEISKTMDSWSSVTDFYTPTIYINGRGTLYEKALASYQAYTAKPIELEQQNMLNDRFYAYFTSDGFSSCFRLPVTELAEKQVTCRIYHTLTDYVEWVIPANGSSDTKNFFGTDITMYCNREKGSINFIGGNEDYPIPMMNLYHENNIKITAYKTVQGGLAKIASSTCSATYDSRIFVSGDLIAGNEIYSAVLSNPLYFPKYSSVVAGEPSNRITAMAVYGEKLIAFKKNELYTVTIKKGSPYSTNSILADSDLLYLKADTLSIAVLNTQIGCNSPLTVKKSGNSLVWLAEDRAVYAMLSGESGKIYELSSRISPLLEQLSESELKSAFAVNKSGYYFLITGYKAIIMDYGVKGLKNLGSASLNNVSWYLWEFPSDISICGGIDYGGDLRLICLGNDRRVCYVAELDGFTDTDIIISGNVLKMINSGIKSSFSTRYFDFGNMAARKRIEEIFIAVLSDSSVTVSYILPQSESYENIDVNMTDREIQSGALKTIRLLPCLRNVSALGIRISSKESFGFESITFNYSVTSD